MSSFLTAFREANLARCALWHADGVKFRTPEGWFGAVAGEVGEMLAAFGDEQDSRWIVEGRSGWSGSAGPHHHKMVELPERRRRLMDEVADVAIYLDLFSASIGHDVSEGDDDDRLHPDLCFDLVFPAVASRVLVLGDTWHKLERATRDPHEGVDPCAVRLLLKRQINQAFTALDVAAMGLGLQLDTVAMSKFNGVSARRGLPVRLVCERYGFWRVAREVPPDD